MIQLYDYFRSSASYRVRVALYLKNLEFQIHSVDLVTGEQRAEEYTAQNPQGLVPTLVDGDVSLSQSMAIIEYLDDKYGAPKLVEGSAEDKAYIRQMAQIIACDTHPLNNLCVWKDYVGKKLGADESQMQEWYAHWITKGLSSYEEMLKKHGRAGKFTLGDQPSLADLCLIPQIYNARRFNVDLGAYPKILEIERNCVELDAFQKAAPEAQKSAPKDIEQIHGVNSPILKLVA
ncbi:MAG: maleylacetoacetate isomerase [Alphaproteobacteria bacterium]|nr:maleylacetoacetate isomerase [Alphaproteobacteria bacterium]